MGGKQGKKAAVEEGYDQAKAFEDVRSVPGTAANLVWDCKRFTLICKGETNFESL